MSVIVPPVSHPSVRNARTHLAPRIAAAVVTAFLSLLALSAPVSAQAPSVQAPNPSFPVGSLSAFVTMVQTGTKPTLQWSTHLPPNANASDYTFFILQKQPGGLNWYLEVPSEGEQMSAIPIDTAGSTFQFWAVNVVTTWEYLLDTTTVGNYLPTATVAIRTEDPYAALPRTRADRPFYVDVTVNGLNSSDPNIPDSMKAVTFTQHVQPYGPAGTGDPLDRTQATLLQQPSITTNGSTTMTFPLTAIPGANAAKARGEERFSIYSKAAMVIESGSGIAYNRPPLQIDSQFVQIWPVADANISGIAQGQIFGASVPQLTLQLNDLYPDSTTYAQVYKGAPQTGITGTTLPGSSVTINDSVPANRIITLNNYGAAFDSDGIWTMELLTQTPFGTDRLAQVSFTVQRSGTMIADWRQSHFGSASNSGDGADDNDFDHDGLANLIEFAFGSDPKQGNAGVLPAPQRDGDQFTIRFTPPAGITGLLYGAEWSTTLAPDSWTAVPNTGTLPEHVFSVPTANKPQLYLRLKATAP